MRSPAQQIQPEEHADCRYYCEEYQGARLHLRKAQVNRGRQEKHDVQGIDEALLVDDFHSRLSIFLIDDVTIKGHLNLVAHFGAIRVASVEQEFARPHPARIEVAHLGLQLAVLHVNVELPRQQHSGHIERAGCARQQTQEEPESKFQTWILLPVCVPGDSISPRVPDRRLSGRGRRRSESSRRLRRGYGRWLRAEGWRRFCWRAERPCIRIR